MPDRGGIRTTIMRFKSITTGVMITRNRSIDHAGYPRLSTITWLSWGLILALAATTLVLRVQNFFGLIGPIESNLWLLAVFYWLILVPVAVPAYATVGAVIVARRPANWVGWLCLALALLVGVEDFAWQASAYLLELTGQATPVAVLLAWLAQVLNVVGSPPLPLTLMLLLFPRGRLLSRRWLAVAWLAVAGALLEKMGVVLNPILPAGLQTELANPTGVEAARVLAVVLTHMGSAAGFAALVLAALALVYRWRQARGYERQQLKWLVYAGAVIGASGIAAFVSSAFLKELYLAGLFGAVLIAGLTMGIPAALTIAILRYRLYKIDIIINQTLVYGTLTVALGILHFSGVLALQQLFRLLTGQGSQLAIGAATLAIVFLFNPLRDRIQVLIDRRFYREKYDAGQVLAAFSARLRTEVDLDRLTDELLAMVEETMQPGQVSLWLRPPESERINTERKD